MRPNGPESIRAVQAALAEVIAPELTTPFAQDTAQTLQMLLESLAAQWDTAAEELRRDNETLERLLTGSRDAMKSAADRNENFAAIVSEIERRLSEEGSTSIAVSALAARNDTLRETLQQISMAFEDTAGQPGLAAIESARDEIYEHLRRVASGGWSFWDVSSFRGQMTAMEVATGGDDALTTRRVE